MDEKTIEQAYLEELDALEKFRISYSGLHPEAPLSREDPDVRRMVEALAFFSARTRVAAERTADESLMRLFRQHFPYVLNPMPAMAMLRADVTPRYVDALAPLPKGTGVSLTARAGRESEVRFRFQTTAPLRVLPLELASVQLLTSHGKGRRILVRFSSEFPRNDAIGTLSLHVSHLNDLASSMAVLLALKTHVRQASVSFEDRVDMATKGQPLELSFGGYEVEASELEAFEGPIERFRAFLHFPQRELFVHLRGISPPRNWQRVTVMLDLDDDWPTEVKLTADTFALHIVPIVNICRDMANPLECDGTKERYLLRHPDSAAGFVLHSLLGVYRMTGKGMVPIEPGVLGPTTAGWEVELEGKDDKRRGWLALDLPGAFERPERVAVEAFWTQPSIVEVDAEQVRVSLSTRHTEGLLWSLSGGIAPPGSSDVEDDRADLLQLLSLKSQRFLGLDELTFLLRALGSLRRPQFAKLTTQMSSVRLQTRPAGRKSGGVSNVYSIELDRLEPADLAYLDPFCHRLLSLLEAWSIEQVVEIVATVPRLGREFRYARLGSVMPSTSSLWFSVEAAFRVVREQCVETRASLLAAQRSQAPGPSSRGPRASAGSPRDSDPRFAAAADLARDLAFREAHPTGPDLVALRASVRNELFELKGRFAEALDDHDTYYALFPIVVYFDELVQVASRGEAHRWESLQSELYDEQNGGEQFFTILDDHLRRPDTNPFELEVFYFCLSDGFVGALGDEPRKITEYKEKLAARIVPRQAVPPAESAGPRVVEIVPFPVRYYVLAAAAVILTYALLSALVP